MKVNHIKQLFVALFLLLSAGTATAAQWKLAKTNLNAAGSKDTLTLKVSDNSFSFSSFQVDFTLSEGILLDGTPILGELANDHALTWSKQSDGSFRCVVYSAGNKDMKAPEGPVLRIPVVLAASFEGGKFTAKNGLLSNKASNGQSVKDLSGATLTAYKERAHLVVNVSGQEQVVNPAIAAGLSYTTIPEDKTLTVAYFKDDSCKIAATDNDRKEEGILYVKLSYAGDTDYAEFEEVYVMSLTSKIAIDASKITKPQTTGIKEGQLLSTSLLSGGSVKDEDGYTIAGTFVWTNGNAVMPAGKQSCSVTFYPDNSSYYNTAEVSVEVEVTPTYLVTATGTTGGTVNVLGKTEDDVYVKGQEISLVALSLPNYKFESWSVTGASETLPANDSIFVKADNNKTYTANFSPIMRAVTINHVGNGSLSVTAEGAKLRAVALPDAGYSLDGSVTLSGVTGPTNDLWTVTGDVTAKAAFGAKKYMVKASAVSSNPTQTASGTITLEPSGEQPYGTEVRIASAEGQNGARLLTILANGKEISQNDVLTVTGDLTVTAVFDPRVNIEKTYILWPYQEYYYSGVSRNFVPFASQTYAGFSFEVLYKNTKGEKTAKAIDADNYTVLLHREEDGLYNEFKGEYKDGLVIHKSKVSVTEAPTNGGNPKTRPAEVDITSTTTNGVTKYVIEPNSDAAKKNYEGTVYYHSTKDPVNLSFGESILRAGGEPVSPMGYVRVTNGGMPYDATDGKVSIPAGITVTLEAVPAEGAKFSHWSDIESNPVDAKKNPREYVVAEGSTGVTPEFVGKDKLEFKLAQTSSVYNGAAQLVSVTGTGNEACQITFFFDEACTQPAVLKNVDKYYVRVYRSADAKYKEYTEVFPYAIEQAEPAITKWPDASDILLGHTLAESILQGGNPGIVAGTFAWSKPETAPTATGQQEVTFTPTDPNYKPVSSKIEVKVVSATFLDPVTPPVDPVDPENPDKPDQPDTPTGIESIEEGMSLYTANQSIFVNMPQQVALKVVDVSGIVLYEGSILGKAEIPVGHAGVYFVRCEAFGDSFVRKVVVR